MRVVAIKNPKSEAENRLIQEMHRLRARIFRGRLAWKVRCTSGLEIDRFDKLRPTYVLCLDHSDAVIGCARFPAADQRNGEHRGNIERRSAKLRSLAPRNLLIRFFAIICSLRFAG